MIKEKTTVISTGLLFFVEQNLPNADTYDLPFYDIVWQKPTPFEAMKFVGAKVQTEIEMLRLRFIKIPVSYKGDKGKLDMWRWKFEGKILVDQNHILFEEVEPKLLGE